MIFILVTRCHELMSQSFVSYDKPFYLRLFYMKCFVAGYDSSRTVNFLLMALENASHLDPLHKSCDALSLVMQSSPFVIEL